jgi:hypothetical protein
MDTWLMYLTRQSPLNSNARLYLSVTRAEWREYQRPLAVRVEILSCASKSYHGLALGLAPLARVGYVSPAAGDAAQGGG